MNPMRPTCAKPSCRIVGDSFIFQQIYSQSLEVCPSEFHPPLVEFWFDLVSVLARETKLKQTRMKLIMADWNGSRILNLLIGG